MQLGDDAIGPALRGVRAVMGLATRSLAPALMRLTLPQARVLLLLRASPGLQVGEIGALLEVSPSGATRFVARLERDGWVQRRREVGDRRAVTVRLTPKGRRLAGTVEQRRREELHDLLAGFDDERRELVVAGLQALADGLHEPPEGDADALLLGSAAAARRESAG